MSQKLCGDPTVPLGNVFQCFPITMLKVSPCPLENLPFSILCPLTPNQSPCTSKRLAPSSLCPPTRYVRSSLSLLLLRLERPHSLSQPVLAHNVFHSPHLTSLMTFSGPTQCTSVILVLGSPKQDTALEMEHLEEVSFE